ncbi:MAG: choice-of-anchor tandem repeat GloVer-containing protein [Methylotetracoccus sp.]
MPTFKRFWLAPTLGAMLTSAHAAPFSTVYTFSGKDDGATPKAGLVAYKGALYGTTFEGGPDCFSQSNCNGTIFRFDPETGNLKTVYAFTGNDDGESPSAPVCFFGGQIYGTTSNFGNLSGTVFQIDPKTGTQKTLHTFTNGSDSSYPIAGVSFHAGKMFGTTAGVDDGTYMGSVFQWDPTSQQFTTLYGFSPDYPSPSSPMGGVAFRGSKVYGTTSSGGAVLPTGFGCGIIFQIDPDTKAFRTIHEFIRDDGCIPTGDLLNVSGNFYGTTSEGGANNYGTVFRFNPVTRKLASLHSFNLTDGAYPRAGLILHGGFLYGTTAGISTDGTPNGNGTVFRLNPRTKVLKTLYTFAGSDDGANPLGALVEYGNALYGTTSTKGAQGNGTVFRIDLPKPASDEGL